LTLVHSGFAPVRPVGDYQAGWIGFLNYVKGMLEGGDGWRQPEFLRGELVA
jgi:hypothetical protein